MADPPIWAKVATKVVATVMAVGSYYIWHSLFGIPSAPSVVAAIIIWTPVG